MGGEHSNITYDNLNFAEALVGFENRSNTLCYANCVLQVLYHTARFRELIVTTNEKSGIMFHLAELFRSIQKNKKTRTTLSTKKLMSFVQDRNQELEGDRHQDCHQFFMWLINQINEYQTKILKKEVQNYNGKIHFTNLEKQMFGVRTTRTICNKCRTVSQRDEKEVDLSLHLPEPNVSLSYCIKQYSSMEEMKGQNKFDCEKCNSKQEAQKTTLIKTLPKYLVIHLKRFKYDQKLKGLAKIFWHIAFPLQLRAKTNYDEKGEIVLYKLYGVIVHIGQGSKYGHYITIVRIKNKWIQFNDEDIEVGDEHMMEKLFGIKNSNYCAYMLFYEK